MSIEKHKAFFKSLDNEKMLPESFYRLLIPEIDRYQHGDEALSLSTNYWYPVDELWIGEHVLPKVVSRRAESRQIPDLKEKVKELVRDAMGTVQIACEPNLSTQLWCERTGAAQKFYDLCAPEVKP